MERVVEYSFIELARHRARLRALFGVPDVVSLAVDEELNRVVIGLEDPSSKAAVLALAAELAVPVEVITFSQESRARMLSMSSGESPPPLSPSEGAGTLRRPIADGKLRGGYQVEAEGGKICTLGFTAVLDSGGLVFVSNSHCSKIPWSTDFGDWGQPKSDDTVGVEVDDPPTRRCGILRRKCRDSDASMMAVKAGVSIALGEIGRTTERNRDCTNRVRSRGGLLNQHRFRRPDHTHNVRPDGQRQERCPGQDRQHYRMDLWNRERLKMKMKCRRRSSAPGMNGSPE